MDDSTHTRTEAPHDAPRHRGRDSGSTAGPFALGLVAALIFLGLFLLIDRAWEIELEDRQSAAVASELASLRTQVESVINGLVHSTIGLAAYAYVHPDLGTDEFERVAERIYRGHEDLVISLTLARGPIVEFVYPLEGNEGVVGAQPRHSPRTGGFLSPSPERARGGRSGPLAAGSGRLWAPGARPGRHGARSRQSCSPRR